jgi:hypothetical protein
MNDPHTYSLNACAQRLTALLMFRGAVRWATGWFLLWGVVILAARFAGVGDFQWLIPGLLGAIPIAIAAAIIVWRRQPPFTVLRAEYDRLNACGGVIMSEETSDMSAWRCVIPGPRPPRLKWRSGPALGALGLSALFVAVTLLLPERLTMAASGGQLEVGQLVEELMAEVEALEEEEILEENKAKELEEQLARLGEQSSGLDPNRTWEALDHIKQSNSDLGRQAAEEALAKLTALTQSETLGTALQTAAEAGLGDATATRAAQDLAGMLKTAKLEEGLLDVEIPPGLISDLANLDHETMEKLLAAIKANKDRLGKMAGKLANLKLIDAKLLAACKNAGICPNTDALAAFLCESGSECDSFSWLAASYCRGGVTRGRGDAPMTWTDPSSEDGAKFLEEVLPPSAQLSDAQLVGVTRAAPDLSGDDVIVEHGALAGAQGHGGSALSQTVLPRHRTTVRRFFAREE